MESNLRDEVFYAQPQTFAERREIASACALRLNFTIPTLIDAMDNAVNRAFNAWPERLYVLSPDGRVAYQGGRGPFEFDPEELARFLAALS